MLTRLYANAVIADPELAYRVWLLWAAGLLSDEQAAYAFLRLFFRSPISKNLADLKFIDVCWPHNLSSCSPTYLIFECK